MTGVETFILQLAVAQKRMGNVPALTLELQDRAEVARVAATHGIAVHDFPARSALEDRLPRKVGTALLRSKRVGALVALLRQSDVLHIHAVGISGLDAYVAAAVARTRAVIVTHHTTVPYFVDHRDPVSRTTVWLEKKLASAACMPYARAGEELVEYGFSRDRVVTIPYCVDEEHFAGRPTPPRDGALRLVMVARMIEGKGHDHLLQAMALLLPRHPHLRLMLVGDGPTRPSIEADIRRLGLGEVVELKGRVDHPDMPALLRTAHLVLLPSHMHGETFPLSLMEGMSMGLPAIGSRWFGIPDIIADGETGFLVEPRDPVGLAAAIERFLVEPSLYLAASRKAAERVRERFTGTAVARAYQGLYTVALAS
jgi:glycosyltransferase involved in cell wall biosynthesis